MAEDLANTSATIEYYQTLPDFAKNFTGPNREATAQLWLNGTYFSHPPIDGMFLTDEEGRRSRDALDRRDDRQISLNSGAREQVCHRCLRFADPS